jgi:heme/copper-type cytochrome/quinol oxidase subunit 2
MNDQMKVELAELVLIIIVFFIIIVVIIVVVVVVVVVVVRYASATFTRSSPHRAACNSLVSHGGCSN